MASANDDDKSASNLMKERRFKLSRACDRCRRRRIKCDEGHPCQACISANSSCTFEEPGKRTHPHKSKRTATLEDRMHHLESLIQAIPPAVFAAGSAEGPEMAFDSAPSPLASFASSTHTYPSGVPPPSLHVFPLSNPSTHFTAPRARARSVSVAASPGANFQSMLGTYPGASISVDDLVEQTSKMSLSASYLYFDDEGYTRWQGETSGFPLLDLLLEHLGSTRSEEFAHIEASPHPDSQPQKKDWFPNRTLKRTEVNPQMMWRLITSTIPPDLMDSLVQCYLCTSYYLIPFLHVPTFLSDYGNPQKWGEPGFASFIVAMCCLASRHTEDPRVRADPNDGVSAGTQWFELFGRLRTLPISDRPTLYAIQADLVAAVYATGLGKLSRAASLLSEAVTYCIDAGMHRSVDTYDLFDPIEDQVRKRTFWSVYLWDKQLCAHFGRPSMIRLRDCDVGEPAAIDDEFISRDSIGSQPPGTESRMGAFICTLRIMVVLESVLDVPPVRQIDEAAPFLMRASSVLAKSQRQSDMREEEILLDEIHLVIPSYWSHSSDTFSSGDVIRITQAERLHCIEQFVRMLVYRHRFSNFFAERALSGGQHEEQGEAEIQATAAAHSCALTIVSTYIQLAAKGLMTYYGVHVIHQLTQAGRTLIAILLNCKSDSLQSLIPSALDALRSCVGLLRRFSGRYVCGQRSGDLMEEFCRLTKIPLDAAHREGPERDRNRPPWIRPVRKKAPSSARTADSNSEHHSSPEAFSPNEFFADASTPQTLPLLQTTFSHSPRLPTSARPRSSSTSTTYPLQSLASTLSSGVDATANMDMNDPNNMFMLSEDVMALFNDGSVDMAALFQPEADFGSNGAHYESPGQESKRMMEFASPSS
ncbi:hypothetical protein HWV62_9271 [Athelia sp. TMB]|nr:hypothetical protein HWV62_9271 [Athelia sp. TMB]